MGRDVTAPGRELHARFLALGPNNAGGARRPRPARIAVKPLPYKGAVPLTRLYSPSFLGLLVRCSRPESYGQSRNPHYDWGF
jgi:hypothetical protein